MNLDYNSSSGMVGWISNFAELDGYLKERYGIVDGLYSQTEVARGGSLALRIPYHYADLIDWRDHADPLRLICMPQQREAEVQTYELADPIGDHVKEVVPGLIHRYPDRCLLLLTSHCRIHCRFCFRREVVGTARPINFSAIKKYLESHPEIREVIFSGGDPGTFPTAFLDNVRRQLSKISHINRWRFHTRVPVADPAAISEAWLEVLAKFGGQKIVVLHVDHPRELSSQVELLLKKMLDRHILLLSQSVLLKNVNADVNTLTKLFVKLVSIGVKPYYLHHLDAARGTSHFRISLEEGTQLFRSLRGNLSSICLPEYVLDLPGGLGKIPVLWLEKTAEKKYKAVTFENIEVIYTDQAIT